MSPPVIETVDELCVIAGEVIEFEVIATDSDIPLQQLKLTALGGPFVVDINPATFVPNDEMYRDQPVVGTFRWETTCEHISDQFYSVVFKAVDDFIQTPQGINGLATLKTVTIKVVGPQPEDVQAVPNTDEIEVSWESPYSCEVTQNDYFKGFSVWRKLGSNQFPLDTCDPGLAGKGYTKIASDVENLANGRYFYIDTNVERGRNYCYRILADFAKTSAGGYNYNPVESLPSDEVCVQLSRDVPLITNVSVLKTDSQDGRMFVQWSTPKAEDLDTIQNPPPYTFEVWRATGITNTGFNLVPGATFTANSFSALVDTNFVDDTGLNTLDNAYTYKIAFYVTNPNTGNRELIDFTNEASSTLPEYCLF